MTLKLVPPDAAQRPRCSEQNPWRPVMEGFKTALEIAPLGHPDRARLLRCYEKATRLDGRKGDVA